MTPGTIYAIRNTLTDDVYVGSTFDLDERWPHHQSQLNAGIHRTGKLQRAWTQYGADNFVCEVLETVREPVHLWAREQTWIQRLDSISNGYNHNRVVKIAQRIVPKNAVPRVRMPGTSYNPFTREQSIEAFWKYVDRKEPDDCWLWTGATANYGYGVFNRRGKLTRAHRFSYELANGPIIDGLIVRHLCHIPACVNPAHLCVGTMKDNYDDMVRAGRARLHKVRAHGERHFNAKLNRSLVKQIFERRINGERIISIANDVGLAHSTVWSILMGKHWKHVRLPDGMRETAKRMIRLALTEEEFLKHFWNMVERTDTCWWFVGQVIETGYGTMRRDNGRGVTRKVLYAATIAYEALRGPLCCGQRAIPVCGTRRCVNPDHVVVLEKGKRIRNNAWLDYPMKGEDNATSA